MENRLSFGAAFKYPFKRFVGMFNIFWLLIPIVGWFAFGGYRIRIIQGFSRGEFQELPKFDFMDNLSLGFKMFFKVIPFFIALFSFYIILGLGVGFAGIPEYVSFVLNMTTSVVVMPMLMMNFFNKQTVASSFEFSILKEVFANFGDYIVAILKDIGLALIFILMWIIIIGIPAGSMTKSIFIADFYGRRIKKGGDDNEDVVITEEKREVEL